MEFLDKVFKRFDIGIPGEQVSFFDCAEAAKVKRALRRYLSDEYVFLNRYLGWQILRLSEILHDPDIAIALEKMQPGMYGGAAYRLNVHKLRKAFYQD